MGLPNRWLQYTHHGSVIPNTRFIAFKAPLKYNRVRGLPHNQQFTPASMMQSFPRMKFVIDLTNSDNYYDYKEFTLNGITYVKIETPGKEVPSRRIVEIFNETIDRFLSMARRDDLIGVHCTHGLNRTGFLICHYMIERMRMSPRTAIQAFERARGHKMERMPYLRALESLRFQPNFPSRNVPEFSAVHMHQLNGPSGPRGMHNGYRQPPLIPLQVNGGVLPPGSRRPPLLPTPPIPANLSMLNFPVPPFNSNLLPPNDLPQPPAPTYLAFNNNLLAGTSLNGSTDPYFNRRNDRSNGFPKNNRNHMNNNQKTSLLGPPPLTVPQPPVSWRSNLNSQPSHNYFQPGWMDKNNTKGNHQLGRGKRKGNWVDKGQRTFNKSQHFHYQRQDHNKRFKKNN